MKERKTAYKQRISKSNMKNIAESAETYFLIRDHVIKGKSCQTLTQD